MVNFIKLGGGDTLCTLHQAEGPYGWVRCRGYMRDALLKTYSNQVSTIYSSHTGRTVQGRAPLVVCTLQYTLCTVCVNTGVANPSHKLGDESR